MADKPKKRNSFLNELKRRNVFRVIAMYAGAAFVIIEVINNVVDPLRLPEWLPTIVILLLIVGFPVTAVLSWIFDLTPAGMKKTGPWKESDEIKEPRPEGRRRLRPSDIVIAVLVFAIGILVYPRIFHHDQLKDARDPDGRVAIAVLPFENRTGDTLLNAWQGGLQELLITGLSNSEELSVRQYQTTNSAINSKGENYASFTPRLFKEVASNLDIRTLINGTFMKAGPEVRMVAQLLDSETEEIYKTFQVSGSSEGDFFSMADSLTWQIKNYVEIKNIKEKRNSSILQAEGYTRSSDAFKYYMHGMDAMADMDMGQAIEWLTKAVETDTLFNNARIFLAHAFHMNGTDVQARQIVNGAYGKKEDLSVKDRLMLEHLHAYFFETPYDEMKYAQQLVSLDEMNPVPWHILAVAHYKVDEFEEAISCWEQLFEIQKRLGSEWQNPFAYFMLADSYFQMGEFDKEGKILETGNRLFPENGYIQAYRLIWALKQNDKVQSDKIMDNYMAFRHNITQCPEALISTDMGYVYCEAGLLDEAEEHYRSAIEMEPQNDQYQFNLAKFLIDEEVNVDEGIEIVDRLLASYPAHWELQNYKGIGLYKKGEYQKALELLESGWENKPIYNHAQFLHLQEAEKAVASLN